MRHIEFLILILLASILALASTAHGGSFDAGRSTVPIRPNASVDPRTSVDPISSVDPIAPSVLDVRQTTGPLDEFPPLPRELLLPPELVERWKERARLGEALVRDLERRQFDERSELEILRLLAVNACDWAGAAELARRADLLSRRHRRRLRQLEARLHAEERRRRHEELTKLHLRPWKDLLRGLRPEAPEQPW